jgi:hypothetical protein
VELPEPSATALNPSPQVLKPSVTAKEHSSFVPDSKNTSNILIINGYFLYGGLPIVVMQQPA